MTKPVDVCPPSAILTVSTHFKSTQYRPIDDAGVVIQFDIPSTSVDGTPCKETRTVLFFDAKGTRSSTPPSTASISRYHPYAQARVADSSILKRSRVHIIASTKRNTNSLCANQDKTYLLSPTSPPSSSPPSRIVPSRGSDRFIQKTSWDAKPKTTPFVSQLVGQAVKSLAEIWPREYVPAAFFPPTPHFGDELGGGKAVAASNDISLETFVHEVLRRSRTTCSVLQSALCYVEALRNKVPLIVDIERAGRPLTKAKAIEGHAGVVNGGSPGISRSNCSSGPCLTETTVLAGFQSILQDDPGEKKEDSQAPKCPLEPFHSEPDFPSPLLCPRRTFIAAVVLASKCLQDRTYSNRAWAKVCGFPAREISRCERALGEALDWRLWVGKNSFPPKKVAQNIETTFLDALNK